jgi:hypothetical protein
VPASRYRSISLKEQAAYSVDFDPDSDFDPEERKSQQADPLDARTSRQ